MSIGAGSQMSNFPYGFNNGAMIRGVAVQPATPGRVLWVYNGTALAPQGRGGSDGNDGSFLSPKATIAGALLQCVAGRGDVVYVKPGHSETITSATYLNLNVAGVQVVGLGNGASRPTLFFSTSTAATLTISAAGISLINFNIDCTGLASLAQAITITAADCTLQGNTVLLGGTNIVTLGIGANASANGLTIDSNVMRQPINTGTTTPIQIVGGSGITICNNYIDGYFVSGTGAISNITTAATDLLILGNTLQNMTATNTKVITCVAGTTGQIARNNLQILSGTAPITAAGMSWAGGNYYAATVGAAGTLI